MIFLEKYSPFYSYTYDINANNVINGISKIHQKMTHTCEQVLISGMNKFFFIHRSIRSIEKSGIKIKKCF